MKKTLLLMLAAGGVLFACTGKKDKQRATLDAFCAQFVKINNEEKDPSVAATRMTTWIRTEIQDTQILEILETAAHVDPSKTRDTVKNGVEINLGIKGWDCPALSP
jgi:hypothetical protein